MGKVVVIGIDGMDYRLLNGYLPELPNLSKISQAGVGSPLLSVYPADSIPSWITIYTGDGPEKHGIIRSIDYLKKDFKKFSIDTTAFRGRTFWDDAGKHGKKVCVINPFMAYPVWPVNGVMVSGPVFTTGDALYFPENIGSKYGLSHVLGGIEDFPTEKTLDQFVHKCKSDTLDLANYSLKLFKGEVWDLFFVTFLTLDRLQHFLWRYTDSNDPTYPGPNRHEGIIKAFYKLFDEIIGEYLSEMREEDYLIVISDHGHGMRCTKYLNVNEYLRRRNYLQADVGKVAFISKKYWVEKAKNFVLQTLFTLNLEDFTYLIARFVPNRQKLKTSDFVIKKADSNVRLSDFAGSGPYGGIDISPDIRASSDYERLRNDVIDDLWSLNRQYGEKIFKWIQKSDEMFKMAPDQVPYPDIVFELYEPYGVNWGLFISLISRNPFHKKISGGHNSVGILFSNASYLKNRDNLRVHDVKSLVLEGLNVING
jgi:predicted AlkP superfamily phosphohydrolase/phosphomutase